MPIKYPQDLYIITTAMKRDSLEWEGELANYHISKNPKASQYKNKVVIDSWNNIKKYKDISNAFFIFDEDRVTGSGVWVKSLQNIMIGLFYPLHQAILGNNTYQFLLRTVSIKTRLNLHESM